VPRRPAGDDAVQAAASGSAEIGINGGLAWQCSGTDAHSKAASNKRIDDRCNRNSDGCRDNGDSGGNGGNGDLGRGDGGNRGDGDANDRSGDSDADGRCNGCDSSGDDNRVNACRDKDIDTGEHLVCIDMETKQRGIFIS